MLTRRSFAAAAAASSVAACGTAPSWPADAAPAAPASWRTAPDAPYAVQEIYPVLYRGGLWVAGGFSPQARGATERVIVFDVATQQWRDGPALPTPSHHVQLAVRDDELWAIGGFIGGPTRVEWHCTPRVLKLQGDAWVDGPALPKPIAEGMPITHQGRVHLIGGRSPRGQANTTWNDQADVADHLVFTAGATQWEPAAPLPMARNSHAGATNGGVIHVISGRTVANGETPAHHIYDARAGRWREGHPFPEPRGGVAAANWRGRVVAGGGEIFQPPSVGDTLYEYDDNAGWRRLETMPRPRHGHAFVAVDTALYTLGGAGQTGARGAHAAVDILS